MDRLLFLITPFLWPLHGVVILIALGTFYGASVIADFTLALSLTAPLYFAVNYSLSTMIVVRPAAEGLSGAMLHLRLGTSLVSLVAVWPASVYLGSTVSVMVALVWTGKVGDMLFEAYQACVIAQPGARRRGWVLFVSGCLRLGAAQAILWSFLLGTQLSPTALLLALAAGNLAVCATLLIAVPPWNSLRVRLTDIARFAENAIAICTPMTVTGAFLSLLIVLPRLLNEAAMTTNERAIVGLAQTAASFAGSIFHAVWLYQSGHLRHFGAAGNMPGLRRAGSRLSLLFTGMLAVMVGVSLLAAAPVAGLLGFPPADAALLVVVFGAISVLHVPAGLRDCLKMLGKYWEEAAIIVATVVGVVVLHIALQIGTSVDWTVRFIAACAGGAAFQFVLVRVRTFSGRRQV